MAFLSDDNLKRIALYGGALTAVTAIAGAVWYGPKMLLKTTQDVVVVPVVEPAVKSVAETVEQMDKNAADFKSEAYSRFMRQDRKELIELEELVRRGRVTPEQRLRIEDLRANLRQFEMQQKEVREGAVQ